MRLLTFLYPLLDKFQQGKIFRVCFSWLFRILGVLVILYGIYVEVQTLKGAFNSNDAAAYLNISPTMLSVTGIVEAVMKACLIIALFQLNFYRAKSIDNLGDSEFTVIPIISILLRYVGEVSATVIIFLNIAGAFTVLLINTCPYYILFRDILERYFLSADESQFLKSVIILVVSLLIAILDFTLSYFMSESFSVTVNIARNVKRLVEREENITTPS